MIATLIVVFIAVMVGLVASLSTATDEESMAAELASDSIAA